MENSKNGMLNRFSSTLINSDFSKIFKHELMRSGSIYFLATVVTSVIGFMVLPIMSHFLTVDDIGVIGIFMMLTSLMTPIIGMSMNTIIAKSYFSDNNRNILIGSSQIFSLLIFLSILFISLIIPNIFFRYLGIDRLVFLSVCLVSFFGINNAVMMTIYQLEKLPLFWSAASLSALIVNIAVTFSFLYVFDMNYWARIWGYIISSSCLVFINLFISKKILIPKYTWNMRHYIYFLKLGLPLIVFACGTWAIFFLDRLFVQFFLGINAVGLYTMAFALAGPMKILSESFSRAWVPYAYENITNKNDIKLLNVSFLLFIIFCFIGLLVFIAGHYIFPFIIDRKFLTSLSIVPILIAGFTMNTSTKLLTPHLLHSEKVKTLATITFTSVIVNTVLNYLLIKPFGIAGAALATMFSLFAMSLMIFATVYRLKIHPQRKEIKE